MPKFCLKQCRDDLRPFRASDAGRIARYAADRDGKVQVAARVLRELEIAEELCRLLKVFEFLDKLEDSAGLTKILSALATIIGGVIKIVQKVPKFGWVLVALGSIQLILVAVKEVLDELPRLVEARKLARLLCSKKE